MTPITLPSGKDNQGKRDLIQALNTMVGPAIVERNIHQVGWWVTSAFLQGYRKFDLLNYTTGELEVSFDNEEDWTGVEDGGVPFRVEEALTRIQTEIGRLLRLDPSPHVKKRAHSLQSLRDSSLSQVILDHMLTSQPTQDFNLELITQLVQYGLVGLAHWPDEASGSSLGYQWEIIPPWELLGIPAGQTNKSELRVLCRSRLFPLTQLEAMDGVELPADLKLLEVEEIPYGSSFTTARAGQGAGGGAAVTAQGMYDKPDRVRAPKAGEPHPDVEKFVKLREFWVLGGQDWVQRFIMQAGQWPVLDKSFSAKVKVPLPIGLVRAQDTGHFYPRAFAAKIIPFALRMESLVRDLITNVRDMDRFGFLIYPAGFGLSDEQFKYTGTPRCIEYQWDPSMEREPIQAIQPVKASDLPGRVASFGEDLMDRIANQGPLFGGQAPGRADSGEAFQVLAETGSTHLLPVASSIKGCYATVYRSMLAQARAAIKSGEAQNEVITVARIDNSVAGISLDPISGQLRLKGAELPDPWSLDIGIRSEDPIQDERRRQEAIPMLERGLITPMEFAILNHKENWNYPIGGRAVWENYIKGVLYNLILFNDGETPGGIPDPAGGQAYVDINWNVDRPEVLLYALEEFTATSEFALASREVQDAFAERIALLKGKKAGGYPEQMPYPEDAAMMAQQGQRGSPAPGPTEGGGGPPR